MGVVALGAILFINSFGLSLGQYSFPDNFLFGVASSAYQIEGAWTEDGKGESIWDHEAHHNPPVKDRETRDIAANSYHKYKEDVALIESMKLTHYKFSLSWTRILPSGFNDSVNNAGVEYYQNLIYELRQKNIIPIVTLYHWDLPQSIQDLGGWTNEATIQYFVDYARVAFESFSDVDYWITIHEPKQVCREGYGNGSLAPFIVDSGRSDYKCAYVVLKAHAAVYHMYKNEFSHLKGRMSISLDGSWSEPPDNTKPDTKAAERRNEFEFGMFANPIFKKDWPQMLSAKVDDRSKKENFSISRLPHFTEEEIAEIHGTADFMALNYYGARCVKNLKTPSNKIYGYENDMAVIYCKNDSWTEMPNGLSIVPWSIQKFLEYVKITYGNPEIIITGNGIPDEDLVHDKNRVNYIADHLEYILKAINESGVNVTGYTYCNLLDSFEWSTGYDYQYGLFGLKMRSTNKTRYAKSSFGFLIRIVNDFTARNTGSAVFSGLYEKYKLPNTSSTPSTDSSDTKSTEASTVPDSTTHSNTTWLTSNSSSMIDNRSSVITSSTQADNKPTSTTPWTNRTNSTSDVSSSERTETTTPSARERSTSEKTSESTVTPRHSGSLGGAKSCMQLLGATILVTVGVEMFWTILLCKVQ